MKSKMVKKSKVSPIQVDEKRAYAVFWALQEAWQKKEGIFANIVLPDDRLALPLDLDLAANFLFFCSITMRGALVSDDPIRWLNQLFQLRPEVFDPLVVARDLTVEKMVDLFSGATAELLEAKNLTKGIGHMGPKYREFARSWIHNARFLAENWQGQVLRIFDGVGDFEEAFARIDRYRNGAGLKGMRRKIFSLLTIWLQCKDLLPDFPTPLPVDFHALRVLMGTGIVRTDRFRILEKSHRTGMENWEGQWFLRPTENMTDAIAQWSQGFMALNGFDHKIINPALWVLSRVLCAGHFQNACVNRTKPKAPAPDDLRPEHWPKGYRDPCRFCPIEGSCRQVFPSGPYYRWGWLIPVLRVTYDCPRQLLLFEEEKFTGPNRSSSD